MFKYFLIGVIASNLGLANHQDLMQPPSNGENLPADASAWNLIGEFKYGAENTGKVQGAWSMPDAIATKHFLELKKTAEDDLSECAEVKVNARCIGNGLMGDALGLSPLMNMWAQLTVSCVKRTPSELNKVRKQKECREFLKQCSSGDKARIDDCRATLDSPVSETRFPAIIHCQRVNLGSIYAPN